jgi:hypothetical protein
LLVGRNVPVEVPPAVVSMRDNGVRVDMLRADVADPADVADVLGYVRGEMAPLGGVVHAAGVLADAALADLGWDQFTAVMDPKVRGAWELHRQTDDMDLDFFVLFSAMGSLLASAGQANYMVANSFLDALATYRFHQGRPALSVGWGPWAEVGMAAGDAMRSRLATLGLDPLSPEEALDGLGSLLTAAEPHAGLARVDWGRFSAAAVRRYPYTLLNDLMPARFEDPGPAAGPDVDELVRLVLREPAAARDVVVTELLDRVAPLLGMTTQTRDALRPSFGQARLNELGLDSLTTVRLRSRLFSDFAIDISPAQLLGGGTAWDIVDLICEQLMLRGIVITADGAVASDEETEVLTL